MCRLSVYRMENVDLSSKALIFANGESHDGQMVQQALQAAHDGLVIAADGGARLAQHFGLVVHYVVGDMDSLSDEELAALEKNSAQIERHSVHKDETDLELALLKAVELDSDWIRIVGALGGRLDQTLSNIYLLGLSSLRGRDVRVVDADQEAYLLFPGEHVIEGEPGDTVSLLPLSGEARGIRTENLYYPLEDEILFFGPARGVSNVIQTPVARVHLTDGVLLVVHTIGRA